MSPGTFHLVTRLDTEQPLGLRIWLLLLTLHTPNKPASNLGIWHLPNCSHHIVRLDGTLCCLGHPPPFPPVWYAHVLLFRG
jgi:hypothetical protein